jgi:hypothetical protein
MLLDFFMIIVFLIGATIGLIVMVGLILVGLLAAGSAMIDSERDKFNNNGD